MNRKFQHILIASLRRKYSFDAPALDKLAKAAKGSIRDSLSLTDQLHCHGRR